MKKSYFILPLLACLLHIQFALAQTNKLYIAPTDCPLGKTTPVELQLDNQSEVVALQFNLHIPDVVTLANQEMLLAEERMDGHTLSVTPKGDNNYLVILMSMDNKPFKNSNGALIRLPLIVPDDLEVGKEHPFTLSHVIISDRQGKNVLTSSDAGAITIVDGNGPDITPTDIRLTSDKFYPGGEVTVQWNVKNIGGKVTEGGWSERIWLVDEAGNEYSLGRSNYKETVSAQGSVARQTVCRIDNYPGIEGNVKAHVALTAFSNWELPVYTDNNEGVSDATLSMPKKLSSTMENNQFEESKRQEYLCFLYRSGSRKNAETFTLTHTGSDRLEVPTSVTIPADESGISFKVKTKNDEIANKDSFAIVSITGSNYPELTHRILLVDDETPALSISAPTETQQEGNKFELTVSRPWETEWPLALKLSTDHPKRFSFEENVTIPAHASSVTVPVEIINDDIPDISIDAVFMASKSGYETGTGFIKLADDDVPEIALDITPTTISEGSGAQAAVATLHRTKVTDNKITVKLTDSSKGMLYYPTSSITLEPGQTDYQFAIGITDNDQQEGDRNVELTAAVYISSCSCSTAGTSAGTVTKEITITDNDGPTLKLTSSLTSLIEGKKEATLLTVTRNTDTTNALTVQISSDLPDEVVHATTVTIPAGETSATIPIEVKSNTTTEGNRTITFTASADGFSRATCWAMITDQTLPDAVITTEIDKNNAYAGEQISLKINIKNEGADILKSRTEITVYAVKQPTLSSKNKIQIAKLYTKTDLDINKSEILTSNIVLPEKTGEYYILAVINESQSIKELTYTNNISNSQKIILASPYSYQVSTPKTKYVSGEKINIIGQVTGNNTSDIPVEVYVINEGYRQSFNVTTDSQGIFQYTFVPQNGLLGHFSLGACYPKSNVTEELFGFEVLGLRQVKPSIISCNTEINKPYVGEVELQNPTSYSLNDIQVELVSVPKNCTVKFTPIPTINANSSAKLQFSILGTEECSNNAESIKAIVHSSEGVKYDLFLQYECLSPAANIESDKESIKTTMTLGQPRDYKFSITNKGKGETGKISISLPSTTWLTLISSKDIPSLKQDESAQVVIRMTAQENMPMNIPITGTIGISCQKGNGLSIPFSIEPVSESTGRLIVDVWDEYTEFTSDAPHVKDATIRIKHPISNEIVAEGKTNEKGLFIVESIAAGYYTLEAEAQKHSSEKLDILIDPGKDNEQMVYLNFQAISYSWEVEETEVLDAYKFVATTRFDTNVPVPVVTVGWPENLGFKDQIIPLLITNRGLIATHNIEITMPESEGAHFTYLTPNPIPELGALQSTIMYVKLTTEKDYFWYHKLQAGDLEDPDFNDNIGDDGNQEDDDDNIGDDGLSDRIKPCIQITCESKYEYLCINGQIASVENRTYHYGKDCRGTGATSTGWSGPLRNSGGGIGSSSGNGGLGTGGGFGFWPVLSDYRCYESGNSKPVTPPDESDPSNPKDPTEVFDPKDPCEQAMWDAVGTCSQAVFNAVNPIKWIEALINIYGYFETYQSCTDLDAWGCTLGVLGIIGQDSPTFGTILGLIDCGKSLFDEYKICSDYYGKIGTKNDSTNDFVARFQCYSDGNKALSTILHNLLGNNMWLNVPAYELSTSLHYLQNCMDANSIIHLTSDYLNYKPSSISQTEFDNYVNKWNETMELVHSGQPFENREDLINTNEITEALKQLEEVENMAKSLGYESFSDLCSKMFNALMYDEQNDKRAACSSISLQFSSSMTMTRQAFRGTLTVYNGHETIAMQNIRMRLEIKDENGTIATAREFQINPEKIDGFGGELTGTWTLDAQKEGTATIVFIPSKYAAPTEAKKYSFGGTLSYIDPFTNLEVTRDLFPVTLTVNPSPNLKLAYFMQRDILGDDPLTTTKVEPSVPAEFALLIQNTGAGEATNVNMLTNQPEIVDNEKGLAIQFELLSSILNGQEKSLALGGSVATSFGNIPAGKTAYAQWQFVCSLLGHFTDYKVEATHLTSYDNPDLSLLDGTPTIHELIRSVKLVDTDLTGFLVNDLVDAEDTPDMIYLTDGSIETVSRATGSIEKVNDTYTLTISPSTQGWCYGSVTDPTGGRQKLVSITRQDDKAIDLQNVWQTGCTLRDGKDPLYENRIHFADKITGTTTYKLTFAPGPNLILDIASFEGVPEADKVAEKPVTRLTVRFNKAIEPATFTTEDIRLVLQGQPQETAPISIQQQDEQSFLLDLTAVTKLDGFYVLTVQTDNITDQEGFTGESGKNVSWTQYLAPGFQTLSMPMATGWNWISVNMEGVSSPVSLLTPVKDEVKRMQSQSQEVINDPQLGLVGNLQEIKPETFYKVEMTAIGKIDITGTVLTPNQVDIPLKEGWNWIGYIPRSAATPAKALALLTASTGDEIKGQTGFAQYNGTTWVGTLDKMEPGKGYMYRAAKAQNFQYPVVSPIQETATLRSMDLKAELESPWTVDIHKYPNNMSLIAELWHEEMKQEPGQYTVAAFCGEECRGIGKYVDNKIFMTVYGNKPGETITFRAVLNGSTTQWGIKETVAFSETTQGSLTEPMPLHLSQQLTANEVILTENGIYPNPVSSRLFIKGETESIRKIQIVGRSGAVLMNQQLHGDNSIDVSPLSAGLYILILEREGRSEYHKFIKK